MCRRFLKGLEEGVEGSLRQHMDLIDDIDAVFSHLRRYADLIHQSLNVLNSVVGSCIKLMNAIRSAFCKRTAGLTCTTWLHFLRWIRAVDHLSKDSCRGGLADPTRATEEVGMRQLPSQNGILESLGDIVLTDECPEGVRPVLSC